MATKCADAESASAADISRNQCSACGLVFPSRNQLFKHLKSVPADHSSTVNGEVNGTKPLNEAAILDEGAPDVQRIEVVAEDADWYRVVCKPQGLATMGSKGATVMNSTEMLLPRAFEDNLRYKKAIPCHRLDKATGGLLLCSKSKASERRLKECFRTKLIRKRYVAIVAGQLLPLEGLIDRPVAGKVAVTRYRVQQHTRSAVYGWISTVHLWPITGRKHQLRKHMQVIGHPIVGDSRYSALVSDWTAQVQGQLYLWAVEIDFPHPQHLVGVDGNGEDEDHEDEEADDDAEGRITDSAASHDMKRRRLETSALIEPLPSPSAKNSSRAQRMFSAFVAEDSFDRNEQRVRVAIGEPIMFEQLRTEAERSVQHNATSSECR